MTITTQNVIKIWSKINYLKKDALKNKILVHFEYNNS